MPWWLLTPSAHAAETLLVLWLAVTVGGGALLITGATPWVAIPVLAAGVVNVALHGVTTAYLLRHKISGTGL